MPNDDYASALARLDNPREVGERNVDATQEDIDDMRSSLRALLVERQEIDEMYSDPVCDLATWMATEVSIHEFGRGISGSDATGAASDTGACGRLLARRK